MGNCKNCIHWGAGNEPIVGFDKGTKKHCGRFVYGLNDVSSAAYLEDGDYASSNGSLWTEPDFGCALVEAKPAAVSLEIVELQPGEQPVPFREVAGYLKDGTPVFYGREP